VAYGSGRSERLLGELLRAHRDRRIYVLRRSAEDGQWPARPDYRLDDVFPAHTSASTREKPENLGIGCLDLQQLHVWTDHWADDQRGNARWTT